LGNLYVASAYGTSGYQVMILKFDSAQLLNKTPVPIPKVITTTLGRGNQMAFDRLGNLCIASFLAPPTVQCYNPNTGVLTYDYAKEFAGFVSSCPPSKVCPTIQPVGLAFGPTNNLYVSSVFAGQLVYEQTEHSGPMIALTPAYGLVKDIGYIATDASGEIYVPSFHDPEARYETPPYSCYFYACQDYDTSSDVVYKINPITGSVTNLITQHIWGPYQMIFVPF
jgi:hypothetical protein